MSTLAAGIAERMYDLSISEAIRESLYLFPALNLVHVLAIVVLAGTIAIVDLRLLGVALPESSISALSRQLLPLTWLGALVMVVTGVLLFLPQASRIYTNPALLAKLALLLFAAANAYAWHRSLARHGAAWDQAARPPWRARLAGASSLLLWIGIIVAGRLIAFIV